MVISVNAGTMYYVATGFDDYYVDQDNVYHRYTNQIKACNDRAVAPNARATAYAKIDTSGIGTDSISAATLSWDEHSMNTGCIFGRTPRRAYFVVISDDGLNWVTIGTYSFRVNPVVRNVVLTGTQRAQISKTSYTWIRFSVRAPSGSCWIYYYTKAYETSQANAVRLDVTHAPSAPITNMKINRADSWKEVNELKINIGDSWKDVVQVKINIGDTWKTVFG